MLIHFTHHCICIYMCLWGEYIYILAVVRTWNLMQSMLSGILSLYYLCCIGEPRNVRRAGISLIILQFVHWNSDLNILSLNLTTDKQFHSQKAHNSEAFLFHEVWQFLTQNIIRSLLILKSNKIGLRLQRTNIPVFDIMTKTMHKKLIKLTFHYRPYLLHQTVTTDKNIQI